MRRLIALAGLIVLLSGCGGTDDRAPFTDSRIPPSLGPGFWAPEGWAWGLIGVGEAPVQRYGVSSTLTAPRANILILTGQGETAEVWFETVRELNAAGHTVWVIERAGQGGSARYGGPHDLIHAPTFDDDIAAVRTLTRTLAQGSPDTPVILIGAGLGGLVALRAVQQGAAVDGLVLSAPDLKPDGALDGWQIWLAKVGLGAIPQGLGAGWKRDAPDAFARGLTGDRDRGGLQAAWQVANPDLRMGGASLGWRGAFAEASAAASDGLAATRAPALLLAAPGGEGEAFCSALAMCRAATLPGARALPHLDRPAVRAAWRAGLESFVLERISAHEAARFPPPTATPTHGL
ncbi:MAG: alpha/beta hydrolase [Caulobacter sp.]|nr:alpha/beta hydrolase [Caulobacter sp.]